MSKDNLVFSVIVVDAATKHWVRKEAGIGRWISEKMFDTYRDQMENLRAVDDQIKDWTDDLKKVLKNAKQANADGRPLDVIFWLGQINSRLKLVRQEGSKITDLEKKHLEDFYGEHEQQLPSDLFAADPNRLVSAADQQAFLIANAGVLDDIGRRITKWKIEKMYEARLREQKMAMRSLLRGAESIVEKVNSQLKLMRSARSSGNIPEYVKALTNIATSQEKFESDFQKTYNAYFKEMADRLRQREEQIEAEKGLEKDEAPAPAVSTESVSAPVPVAPTVVEPETDDSIDVVFDESDELAPPGPAAPVAVPVTDIPAVVDMVTPPVAAPAKTKGKGRSKPKKPIEITGPESPAPAIPQEGITPAEIDQALGTPPTAAPVPEEKSALAQDITDMLVKKNNVEFYQLLEKVAEHNDPYLMATMILKYSEKIEDFDIQKSLELLAIAEGILDA